MNYNESTAVIINGTRNKAINNDPETFHHWDMNPMPRTSESSQVYCSSDKVGVCSLIHKSRI